MSSILYPDFESYCNREVARLGIMPPKLEDYKSIDDMIVKNYTHTDENGEPITCRIITCKCFNLIVDYLYTKHPHFKEIKKRMDIEEKAKEETHKSDIKAEQRVEQKQRFEKADEEHRKARELKEKEFAKTAVRLQKQVISDYKDDNKEYLDLHPDADVRFCENCKEKAITYDYFVNPKIYPRDFIDPATDKPCIIKLYENDKYIRDISCCISCYDEKEIAELERQQSIKREYCDVCDKKYILRTIETNDDHCASAKHKENYKIYRFNKTNHKTYKYRLEWLNLKQLYQICSDSKDDKGFNIIPSYTKKNRYNLIMKMYDVYDQLNINDSLFL